LPEEPKTISFQLPEGKSVEVYLVRLPDGRIVSRTAEELVELPPDVRKLAQPLTSGPSRG
jgi:hypothetical protein